MTRIPASTFEDYRTSFEAMAATEPPDSDRGWWCRSMNRHLRALSRASSLADWGTLLREILRLEEWARRIPAAGFPVPEDVWPHLRRFGISIQKVDDGNLLMMADQRPSHSLLPDDLWRAIAVDMRARRPSQPCIPDKVLSDFFPQYTAYQSPTQKSAVRALLTMPLGASMLVTIPTGGGKSLLFQLGPLWQRQVDTTERKSAVVIVPTVALAIAHERTLQAIPGLEGTTSLRAELNTSERERVRKRFLRGEIPVLIASPEMLFGGAHEWILQAARPRAERVLAAEGRLTTLFVDEAHIIESWGRTFRPDFQRLPGLVRELRQINPALQVVLLSATVGDSARRELRRGYGESAAEWLEIDARVPRYEFDLVSVKFGDHDARNASLLQAIDYAPRPAIVYTTLIEEAESLYGTLCGRLEYKRIGLVTGESSKPTSRQEVVRLWAEDELDLVVATSAFGMGIDKADVRSVIHACVPESAARYYQEIGRGGRDGHQALALCLWWRCQDGDSAQRKDDLSFAYDLAANQSLTVGRAGDRWRALRQEFVERFVPAEFDEHGNRILDLSLDAHPDDMTGTTGRHNRGWNMALLNLLQRAGAVQILEADPELRSYSWKVAITDGNLLATGGAAIEHLAAVLELRNSERAEILNDVRALENVLTDSSDNADCVLVRLFEAIESGTVHASRCGRCWWCLRHEIAPPTSTTYELGNYWQRPNIRLRPMKPRELTVVPEHDDYAEGHAVLLRRLARVGIEQFVVPDGFGPAEVQALTGSPAQLGLFVTHSDILTVHWPLLPVPTAVLFPQAGTRQSDVDRFWVRVREQLDLALKDKRYVLYVVPRHTVIEGRPAVQVLCRGGFCDERELDDWRVDS